MTMASRTEPDFLGSISYGTFNNDYTFLETVGKGGYGEVYKVVSKKDYQTYAVKKVRFDQHRRKNKLRLIKRELINNAQLSHDNVVRYYDSWVEVSADQNLDRMVSTDSETDYSQSRDLISDNSAGKIGPGEEKSIDGPANLNKMPKISSNATSTSSCSELKTNNNCVNSSSDDSGCLDVKEIDTDMSKIQPDNLKSVNDSRGLKVNQSTRKVLPDFRMLQMSMEEESETSINEEDEQSVMNDEEASDIIFDEDAQSDKEGNKQTKSVKDEDEDVVCKDLIDEDNEQISLPDDGELAEILKQISDSVGSEHIVTFDRDTDEIHDNTDNPGPRFLDLYIKMEFCEQTLRDAIDNCKLVDDEDKTWSYFRQIVKGLDYIHRRGITHRDLNPRNIFVTSQDIVKIGDFGLSRLHVDEEADFSNYTVGVVASELQKQSKAGLTGDIGTVWYSAPEVLGKPLCVYGHEIDLFSLGLIFFEMCHAPIDTEQEKAVIFEKLRKERSFPDSFDLQSKEKQTKVIINLLNPNPKERLPLTKLLDPSEGFVVPEPLEEHHFKLMLPEVIARSDGELYQHMIQQLFQRGSGERWFKFMCPETPKRIFKMNLAFASVAESHTAKEINLPLFLPYKPTESGEILTKAVFLDSKGNPVILTDSFLMSFGFNLQINNIPSSSAFYNTQSEYKLQGGVPVNQPQISYFSMTTKEDILAIGKAILILQQSLVQSGHNVKDFVLCFTHTDLEQGLYKLYELGDTALKALYFLCETIGDTTYRLKIVKVLNQNGQNKFAIPEVLVLTGYIQKMSDKLKSILGHLHQSVHGFNEELSDKVRKPLDFIKDLKEILDKLGISFDLKIESFMKNPEVGLTDSGIKFRLRAKPNMDIIARGGHFETTTVKDSSAEAMEFLWYEIDPFKLKETEIEPDRIDVVILYDYTMFEEVKNAAYLYGKLTGIDFVVLQIKRRKHVENDIHISPYCKFLVQFEDQSALVQYEQESKLKSISMNVKTAVNHLNQRRDVPNRRWLIKDSCGPDSIV